MDPDPRIREAQKHVDPDSDPDPQHCFFVCLNSEFVVIGVLSSVLVKN